jgi:hypothetical protein
MSNTKQLRRWRYIILLDAPPSIGRIVQDEASALGCEKGVCQFSRKLTLSAEAVAVNTPSGQSPEKIRKMGTILEIA